MYYWLFMSFFFFKQKTAYEMRISDWSSDVCSAQVESYIASANSRLANYRRSLANARARFAQLTGHPAPDALGRAKRSEEHTSELQSLMRISYAVFCLKKKRNKKITTVQEKTTTTQTKEYKNAHKQSRQH